MARNPIDTMLHRSIKGKSNGCSLLPKSTCEASFLGEGDTYLSMDIIKDSIEQYADQTKDLAQKLSAKDLKQTIDNIYGFLYNNLQYKSDGSKQYLRSPACSCASRKDGIDCKSYSIFAGCLLTNLGIAFRIRKIRQSQDPKGSFSHVYIVVPMDQKTEDLSAGYFVIDGTKHINSEANFIEKHDIIMALKHFGLKGQHPMSRKLQIVGLDRTKRAFTDFLQYLQHCGVNTTVLAKANLHAEKCFQKNQDPPFKIHSSGFTIENKNYPFIPQPRTNGLHGDGEGNFDIGEITEFADGIIGGGLFNNTIGAVLGNGWRLGCWGTSNNPVKSKAEVEQDSVFFIRDSGVASQVNTQTVNKLSEQLSIYLAARNYGQTNPDIAKCTQDGNKAGFAAMSAFKEEMFNMISEAVERAGGKVIIDGYKTARNFTLDVPSGYHDGRIFPLHNYTNVEVPQFRVTKNAVLPNGGNTTGGGSTTGSGGGATTIGDTGGTNNPTYVNNPADMIRRGAAWIHEFYSSGKTSAKTREMITLMQNYYLQNPHLKVSSTAFLPPFIPFDQRPKLRPQTKNAGGGVLGWALVIGTAYAWHKNKKKAKKKSVKDESNV